MQFFRFTAECEADTERLGCGLARALQPRDVVALNGELGAGKTRFVRAIVAALDGGDAQVNSPTFVIVQHYAVRVPVCHIDAYRLADVDEFEALGAEELLSDESVCLIEWADRVAGALPRDHLRVDIRVLTPQSRAFEFRAAGSRGAALLEQLRQTV